MDIPDLDEEETDQRGMHKILDAFKFIVLLNHLIVSQAPKYIARKIPTLKELENDVNFINTLDEVSNRVFVCAIVFLDMFY